MLIKTRIIIDLIIKYLINKVFHSIIILKYYSILWIIQIERNVKQNFKKILIPKSWIYSHNLLITTTYAISSTRNLPKFLLSLNLTSPPPHLLPHISTCRSIDRSIELSSNNTRRSFPLVIEIHSVPSSLNARYYALERKLGIL